MLKKRKKVKYFTGAKAWRPPFTFQDFLTDMCGEPIPEFDISADISPPYYFKATYKGWRNLKYYPYGVGVTSRAATIHLVAETKGTVPTDPDRLTFTTEADPYGERVDKKALTPEQLDEFTLKQLRKAMHDRANFENSCDFHDRNFTYEHARDKKNSI